MLLFSGLTTPPLLSGPIQTWKNRRSRNLSALRGPEISGTELPILQGSFGPDTAGLEDAFIVGFLDRGERRL